MHCVFRHFLKVNIGSRNPRDWNIAADVVINAIMEADKIGHRPKNVIWEPDLYVKGKTTEGVYELLQQRKQGGGGGAGGSGGTPTDGQWDNVEPYHGDESEQAEMEAKWQIKVSQAAAAAKMCGKLSSTMEKLVGDVLKPRVSWADQLRHFFTKRARVDYSYARPNRRFLSQGLYLPGKNGTAMGDILLAVDLSGSVTMQELNEYVAEMRAIKVDCKPYCIHVLYFASEVMGYEKFEMDDELDLHPNGTGGTAFSPIFRYAEDHGIQPEAAVVLTDLICSDFGPPPEYPVMWVSTGRDVAPWGEVIRLRQHA
jgi:predicted metal-dependent peptidase